MTSPPTDDGSRNTKSITPGQVLRFAKRFVTRIISKGRFTPRSLPSLSIETTNICNSNCVFCANSVMSRKKTTLNMRLFEKVVDEFAESGGIDIDLTDTIGDPLLDKKIIERGRYIRSYKQFNSLGFVTTLQWLHKHNIQDFINTFTWIGVSITLSGPESYRQFFGVDKYDQAIGNLRTLLAAVKAGNPNFYVGISLKPTDEDDHTILNHPDFIEINTLVGGELERQVRERTFFVDDWQGAVALPAYLRRRPLYPRAFRPCSMLYNKLMVHSNGMVSACACRDFNANSELVLGSANESKIADLWQGHELRRIRDGWRWKNRIPDICKSCRHYIY